jgi:quinol monooxygenase YgiN
MSPRGDSSHDLPWIARLVAADLAKQHAFAPKSGRYARCTFLKSAMLLASLSFRAQPHKRGEILSAVDEAVSRMRRASGCERCRLLVDTEDPNAFTLISEWHSGDEAEVFFNSREFRVFKGIRILLREEPVIVLDEIQSRLTQLIASR